MGHEGHDHDDHEHGHSHGHGHKHGHQHEHGDRHLRSQSPDEHKSHAPAQVAAAVITCSDTRNEKTDESGKVAKAALEREGHSVVHDEIVADDEGAIGRALDSARAAGARAVIFNGGTGISRRDVTIEALEKRFDKKLPGFGELFRARSFGEVGTAAMMSRATAGTIDGLIVFALPGSPNAVKVGMALLLPELGHAVRELSR